MNLPKTLLAAAVLFALAACQPQAGGTVANAASADDPLLVQQDQDDRDKDDDGRDDEDGDDQDLEPEEDEEAEDADPVASAAEATEQADAATDDALLDTRHGGNPLVNSPIAPVEPIAQEDEDEPEDDDDGE